MSKEKKRIVTCERCEVAFTAYRPTRKFCSTKCQRDGKDYNSRYPYHLYAENHVRHTRAVQIRTQKYAARIKLELGCFLCGYDANSDALQFDHDHPCCLSGKKREFLHTLASLHRVLNDPNIRVLCANCHSIKTQQERRILKKDLHPESKAFRQLKKVSA